MTCEMIKDKLGGVVADVTQLSITVPVYSTKDNNSQITLLHDKENKSVIVLLEDKCTDLKVLRKRLQQTMNESNNNLRAVFLNNESVTVQQMRDVKTLVELLGY